MLRIIWEYFYVIPNVKNNMGKFSHDIPNVENNMGIFSHVIPNVENNVGNVSMIFPMLRIMWEIFPCFPQR